MHASEPRIFREIFDKFLRIGPALDEASRDVAYQLRHEVYCDDFGFLPSHPDRRESDDDDAHSEHCLLHTAAGTPVGCIRLVLTDPADPDAPLPFERPCEKTLDRSVIDPARLPRHRIAEISRLAVRERYRSGSVPDTALTSAEQRRLPFVIPTSLLLAAFALAERREVDSLFALSEPPVVAHFTHLGITARQIGPPISYHGTRIPLAVHVGETIRDMHRLIQPMWESVREQISQECARAAAQSTRTS
jgi:N-acyl amino acid synthase of PEP-CTERM/exosortase system